LFYKNKHYKEVLHKPGFSSSDRFLNPSFRHGLAESSDRDVKAACRAEITANPFFQPVRLPSLSLIAIKLSHFVEWFYGCRCGFIQPFIEELDLSAQYDTPHQHPIHLFLT